MKYIALILAGGLIGWSQFSLAQSVEDGKKMLYYQRYESAKDILGKQVEAGAGSEAYYFLSQTYIATDDSVQAKTILENAPAQVQEDPLVKIGRGQILLMEGKKDEAAALFNQALEAVKKKDQSELMIAIAKAHVQARTGDVDYALQLLNEAEAREKKNPNLYMVRGDAYRRIGNGGEAIIAYTAALERDPKLAKANFNIGKVYLSQNNPESYVKYFEDAIALDPTFAPAHYELYYHYYFRNVNKAKEYLESYIANTDKSVNHEYMLTDLLYVSGKHQEALVKAQEILQREGDKVQPRIYKLLAYSYDAVQDSVKAMDLMNTYFQKEKEEKLIAKDFEFKAKLLNRFGADEEETVAAWEKAIQLDTVKVQQAKYMKEIADLYKKSGDRSKEAKWLGTYYNHVDNPSNTDLYNWGMAHFFAKEFPEADTVFAKYAEKYPDQVYGHYWRARSSAAIDSLMEEGRAIPHYTALVEVAGKEPEKNKNLLIQAYGYLAAYNANTLKEYEKAIEWLSQILVLDPENSDAKANIEILQKMVTQSSASGNSGG
ncbi:MAG TPA: tetratricopeptide repeat protein [Parasegetibacter sp.]